jgi:anti-sigma factor RsiW
MAQIPTTCKELTDLLGAYSIGATTPAENQAIEQLLAECPEAQAELADYMTVRGALSSFAASQPAPALSRDLFTELNLADVIMPSVHTQQPQSHQHTPPTPAVVPPPPPAPERDTQTLARITPPTPPPKTRQFPVAVWYALGNIAATLVLVVGLLAVVNGMLAELRAERAQLVTLVTGANANAPREVVQVIPNTVEVQSVRRLEHAHHVQLTPTISEGQTGQADVIWDPETGVGTLSVSAMPTLPDGTRYQMWLVNENGETSVGLFQVDDDGSGFLAFQSPEPLTSFEVIGISVEPSDGSPAPTTPHLVTGQI